MPLTRTVSGRVLQTESATAVIGSFPAAGKKQPGAAILKRMDRAHMALCCALRLVEALFKLEMRVHVVKHCVSAVCGHNAHIVYALVGVSAEMG